MSIVDAHWHLVDPGRFRYGWLAQTPGLAGGASAEAYLAAAAAAGIGGSVHVEADPHPDDALAEAALAAGPGGPALAAVAKLCPAAPDFGRRLAAARGRPWIRAVRRVLHMGAGGLLREPALAAGVRALGEAGLPFELCVLPGQLPAAGALAGACPEAALVLDHGGLPDIAAGAFTPWAEAVAALAGRPNAVAVKISGLAERAGPGWTLERLRPYLDHLRAVFGPRRLVFATNWPVCLPAATPAAWVGAAREWAADWPETERAAFFAGNARRLYRLDP